MSGNALKSVKIDPAGGGKADGASTADMIDSTHTEELVIALCGPIGSPLHSVGAAVQETLTSTFGYASCTYLRLSQFIEEHAHKVDITFPNCDFFLRTGDGTDLDLKLRVERFLHLILGSPVITPGQGAHPRLRRRGALALLDVVQGAAKFAQTKRKTD